jgi:DNA-binding transcriptional LysR family regulator
MLEKFEVLIALARERHFRRAAERCGVTQPTLSAGIRALEETFGAALVNRGSRYVGLTPEGERVLDWARRITGDAHAMRQEVEVLKRGVSGLVRLACIPTALPIVARLSSILRERHPEVSFSILSSSTPAMIGLLEDYQVDAGITYLDVRDLPGMAITPIYSEHYRLVTTDPDVFRGRTSVGWNEILATPLCLFTPDMQNRRIVNQILGLEPGKPPRAPFTETNSSLVMATLVSSGRWSSIMPPVLIEAVSLSGAVRQIPLVEPEVSHSVGLVVVDREPVTPLVRALTLAARELAEEFDRQRLS